LFTDDESARIYYPGIYRIRNCGTRGGNIERKLLGNQPSFNADMH
jgi:hypothetical protein